MKRLCELKKDFGVYPKEAITVFRFDDGSIAVEDGMTTEYTCGDDPMAVDMPRDPEERRALLLAGLRELES